MKTQKSNNLISVIFGSKKISRVMLLAYILAPIFIFAVGFASWTIVTPGFGFFANGSFVGNELLDSTKYIKLHNEHQPFSSTYMVGGFTNDAGEVLDTTKFSIDFNIELGQCQTIFDEQTGGTLYFTFSLCFADRTESTKFFANDNFTYEVTFSWEDDGATESVKLGFLEDGTYKTAEQELASTGVSAQNYVIGSTSTIETSTTSSYVFVIELNFPANSEFGPSSDNSQMKMSIDYTITPQTAEIYRELMDIIMGEDTNQRGLMSDVRITDYNPY